MQAPLRDRDPQRLGPYRLTARLGRGGMGTVFLGEDPEGRPVAVKAINAELADDEAFHERFRREVTAARQVRPFCTAAVLDARLDGEPLYVVTEYVAGPSLDEAVGADGPLRGGDLEALAVNIATALGAIHGAGIVHRDLKPANVLLSSTGPRVIDFGIARALDAPDGPTRTGQFVGTPAYVAPELMHGEEITPAADVFSWGCVVAYAGTGRAPFAGRTLPEVISRVTGADPDLDGLDPAVRDVVARSLAKRPADRPSVKQLIQALTGEDEPPAAPPPLIVPTPPVPDAARRSTPPTQVEPEPRPEPEPEPATVASPAASVPETSPMAVPPPPPTRAAPAGADRARWRRGLVAGAVAAAVCVSVAVGAALADGDGAPGGSASAQAAKDPGSPPEVDDKVFDDNFSHEDSGWKTASTPTWDASYRDRRYELHVLPTTTRTAVDAPVRDVPRSQLIDVKVESVGAGGEAGVFCHGQSGYGFVLRADGRARIVHLGSGESPAELAAGSVADPRRGGDRVQAACVRDDDRLRLGLWVNGDAVASAVRPLSEEDGDDPGPSGLVAVRPQGAAGWPEAVFDDFSLCSV